MRYSPILGANNSYVTLYAYTLIYVLGRSYSSFDLNAQYILNIVFNYLSTFIHIFQVHFESSHQFFAAIFKISRV